MYENVFAQIQNAKPVQQWAPEPAAGRHRVILKKYAVKTSQKNGSQFPEVEYVLLESSSEKAGETRSTAWFIGAQGWPGTYAQGRAQGFIETVAKCFGDTRPVAVVGADLVADKYIGLVLDVDVVPVIENGQPRKRANGSAVNNCVWHAIPGQSAESMARMRAYLGSLDAAKAPAPTPAPAQQYTAPATQPAPAPQMQYQPPAAAPAPAPVQQAQPAPTTAPSGMPAFLSKFGGG